MKLLRLETKWTRPFFIAAWFFWAAWYAMVAGKRVAQLGSEEEKKEFITLIDDAGATK